MKADDSIYQKIDLDKNPKGTELKIAIQREREEHGRFVRVDNKTLLFVEDGKDAGDCKAKYLERVNNRPQRWN